MPKKLTIDAWTYLDLDGEPPERFDFCSEDHRVQCGLDARDGKQELCEGCHRVRLVIEQPSPRRSRRPQRTATRRG